MCWFLFIVRKYGKVFGGEVFGNGCGIVVIFWGCYLLVFDIYIGFVWCSVGIFGGYGVFLGEWGLCVVDIGMYGIRWLEMGVCWEVLDDVLGVVLVDYEFFWWLF